jgi:hypothetical protein
MNRERAIYRGRVNQHCSANPMILLGNLPMPWLHARGSFRGQQWGASSYPHDPGRQAMEQRFYEQPLAPLSRLRPRQAYG